MGEPVRRDRLQMPSHHPGSDLPANTTPATRQRGGLPRLTHAGWSLVAVEVTSVTQFPAFNFLLYEKEHTSIPCHALPSTAFVQRNPITRVTLTDSEQC